MASHWPLIATHNLVLNWTPCTPRCRSLSTTLSQKARAPPEPVPTTPRWPFCLKRLHAAESLFDSSNRTITDIAGAPTTQLRSPYTGVNYLQSETLPISQCTSVGNAYMRVLLARYPCPSLSFHLPLLRLASGLVAYSIENL